MSKRVVFIVPDQVAQEIQTAMCASMTSYLMTWYPDPDGWDQFRIEDDPMIEDLTEE